MVISSYNSRKIRTIGFLMTFLILVIHGRYLEAETMTVPYWIQTCLGDGICRIAVPTFFFISGLLLFKSVDDFKLDIFVNIIKKRIRTLFVPYVLWCLIFVAYFIALDILSLDEFVNSKEVCGNLSSYSHVGDFWGIILYLFWDPVNSALWYVRDLLLFAVASPIVYLIIKNNWTLVLTLSGLIVWIVIDFSTDVNGLLFFILGGYMSIRRSLEKLDLLCNELFMPLGVLYLLFCLFAPINPYHYNCLLILEICGMISFWRLYDLIGDRIKIPKSWLSYSFFIYCFHMPFYTIIKKGDVLLLGASWWQYSIYYLINPIIAIVIIVYIGKILHNFTPYLYNILTGGR